MSNPSDCQTPRAVKVKGEQRPAPLTNPNLSANLRSEYEALLNDVEQANQLAAELQRQLSGKSNEVAEFKQLFEKTQRDLIHLQGSITELRQERHRLANEAMRAVAVDRKLVQVAAERDRLRTELDSMRSTPLRTGEKAGADPAVQKAVAELGQAVERLQKMVGAHSESAPARCAPSQSSVAEEAFIDIAFDK
jgi:predicted  nucleic acid-binding Zn-ribbon protein